MNDRSVSIFRHFNYTAIAIHEYLLYVKCYNLQNKNQLFANNFDSILFFKIKY